MWGCASIPNTAASRRAFVPASNASAPIRPSWSPAPGRRAGFHSGAAHTATVLRVTGADFWNCPQKPGASNS